MKDFDFKSAPIIDIVNEIITDNVKLRASDIHFDPTEKYLKIRSRIDGSLHDYAHVDNEFKRNLTTRIKLMSGMNITETRLPQDGAIKATINNMDLDLRVATIPTAFGEKIVIRILDYTMSAEGLDALGFSKENLEKVYKMISFPNGIVLVTGATGSGKSTTVYSMLQRLNKEDVNILTAEDPIEMSIEGINQIQVSPEIGLTFGAILRSILRHDPNIILIGEIRDTETAQIAVRASITGHLVLSTLHTNDALSTIERLLDMDVERYLLSTSLTGIISQTLAKKLCKKCRVKRKTNEYEKMLFKTALGKEVDEIYEAGKHCEHCTSGYSGRIALQEVLMLNDEIRYAINDNIDRKDLRRLVYEQGTKTMLQDALQKVLAGITSMEEVYRLIDTDDAIRNIYYLPKDTDEIVKEMQEQDIKTVTVQPGSQQVKPQPTVQTKPAQPQTPQQPKPVQQTQTVQQQTQQVKPQPQVVQPTPQPKPVQPQTPQQPVQPKPVQQTQTVQQQTQQVKPQPQVVQPTPQPKPVQPQTPQQPVQPKPVVQQPIQTNKDLDDLI